jgi:hypothetical protein
VTRVIEARQTAGEKRGQNMFISLFDIRLIAIYAFWHCYFPPKILAKILAKILPKIQPKNKAARRFQSPGGGIGVNKIKSPEGFGAFERLFKGSAIVKN